LVFCGIFLGMKNAIYFFAFLVLIFAVYIYTLFANSNKISNTVGVANTLTVNDFNYSTITNKGDEIFIEGKSLTKNGTVKVSLPKGFVKFTGKEEKLLFNAENLELYGKSRCVLKGNATLKTKDYTLLTDVLELDNEKKILASPTKTTFHSAFTTFKGASFIYNLDDKNLRLDKVEGRIWLKQG